MKKSKSDASRERAASRNLRAIKNREIAQEFLNTGWPKVSMTLPSRIEIDLSTLAECVGLAGDGVRLLLAAEDSLRELPDRDSDRQLDAYQKIEYAILIAQLRFKELAAAALYSLPNDFNMKPEDDEAFAKINEDDEKYSVAEFCRSGL